MGGLSAHDDPGGPPRPSLTSGTSTQRHIGQPRPPQTGHPARPRPLAHMTAHQVRFARIWKALANPWPELTRRTVTWHPGRGSRPCSSMATPASRIYRAPLV